MTEPKVPIRDVPEVKQLFDHLKWASDIVGVLTRIGFVTVGCLWATASLKAEAIFSEDRFEATLYFALSFVPFISWISLTLFMGHPLFKYAWKYSKNACQNRILAVVLLSSFATVVVCIFGIMVYQAFNLQGRDFVNRGMPTGYAIENGRLIATDEKRSQWPWSWWVQVK